jgi:hypothetical protein
MYNAIVKVKPAKNYLLILTFDNGEVREFDMKPYLETGIFKELKDESVFNSVRVSFDSVEWNNEADIDPEILYKNSRLIEKVMQGSV